MEIIRATETWQQAGAYYVRIQAMAKKHHITLRQEFDDHDRGLGRLVVAECEKWARDEGYQTAVLESRDNKVGFYRSIGYEATGEAVDGDTFHCLRMEKKL